MPLDSRLVTAFLTVAEQGSLSRAAQVLNLTQPALTRTIKRLEAQVGAPLFERHPAGMTLTAYGEVLLRRARILESETQTTISEIRALRGIGQGSVRLGIVSSAAEVLLPPVIARMAATFPETVFSVTVGLEDELAVRLVHGELDLAVAFHLPEGQDIQCLVSGPSHDGCCFVSSRAHVLAARADLSLEDIRKENWVLPPVGTSVRAQVTEVFARNGSPEPVVRVETQSLLAMKALVERAGFLTWLPPMLFEGDAAPFIALDVRQAQVQSSRSFSIYCRANSLLTVAASRALQQLRKELESGQHRADIRGPR
ncbi:DNA-binding transcriptional LysR family regulator [Xanthobacter flavus]|uniref:DNA-binding transcriptional LysR family regulator n=1 Tax=Xanthobacter flavus TaxID=281 RepID=A0A9W6FM70_XANFL|nr:LysR family transcriptional regulator [Xanthobacter flavus]MDR6336505.1 DNA-binding transcriptional LysR family regulator [Xanthobacter flavus]GLI25080.1 transcriptional regulator [Xanthobacter flavus]